MEQLIVFVLTIMVYLVGMDIITRLHPTLHRVYRWLLQHLVLRPLRRLGRWLGRQLVVFLRWAARQLGHGIHWVWVRLTT